VKSVEKRSNSQKHAIIVSVNEILSSIEYASEDLGFPLGRSYVECTNRKELKIFSRN
jgi:hypothetical protein